MGDSRVLRLLLERGTFLRELDISIKIDNIDATFDNIRIRAPLRKLSLNAKGLSDAPIPAICQLASSLQILNLYYSENLTSEGLYNCFIA